MSCGSLEEHGYANTSSTSLLLGRLVIAPSRPTQIDAAAAASTCIFGIQGPFGTWGNAWVLAKVKQGMPKNNPLHSLVSLRAV